MNILIVGLGSIGIRHVNTLRSIMPDAKIIALRSHNNTNKYEGVNNIYNIKDVETLDFAIISNPTFEHKRSISQLIPLGIPLFIEKPLHFSLDLDDVVETINSRGIITYVACNLRFLDSLHYLYKELPKLKNKKLNEVNVYCGSYLPDWKPNIDHKTCYSSSSHLGGGVHFDLIHELDYIYWFFGKPIEIQRKLRNLSSLSINSIDYANYLLDYKGFSVNIILNYYRRDTKRNLELVFEDETWHIDLLKNKIEVNGQIKYESKQRISDTYMAQMQYFINCIENNSQTNNTVRNGYDVLKLCIEK